MNTILLNRKGLCEFLNSLGLKYRLINDGMHIGLYKEFTPEGTLKLGMEFQQWLTSSVEVETPEKTGINGYLITPHDWCECKSFETILSEHDIEFSESEQFSEFTIERDAPDAELVFLLETILSEFKYNLSTY